MLKEFRLKLISQISPPQRCFQTRSSLTFPSRYFSTSGLNVPSGKPHQTVSSAEIFDHIIKSDRAVQSIPLTIKVETNSGNSEILPFSNVYLTYEKILHKTAENITISPL